VLRVAIITMQRDTMMFKFFSEDGTTQYVRLQTLFQTEIQDQVYDLALVLRWIPSNSNDIFYGLSQFSLGTKLEIILAQEITSTVRFIPDFESLQGSDLDPQFIKNWFLCQPILSSPIVDYVLDEIIKKVS